MESIPDSWTGYQSSPEFKGFVPLSKVKLYQRYHPDVQRILAKPRIKSNTENWLRERMLHVTATNAAPILSHDPKMKMKSPYTSRNQIFMKKTGRGKPFKSNPACKHGKYYEPEALHVYELVTGIELVPEDVGLLISDTNQEVAATPDAIAKHYPIIIETKCPWRRKITHECPRYYYSQVQVQLAVCGLKECHFVQYYPPSQNNRGIIDIIIIKFDQDWWLRALSHILRFWDEVKTYYMSVDKPIGTMLIDWSATQEKRNRTKRKKIDMGTSEAKLASPTATLNWKMHQKAVQLNNSGFRMVARETSPSSSPSLAHTHTQTQTYTGTIQVPNLNFDFSAYAYKPNTQT